MYPATRYGHYSPSTQNECSGLLASQGNRQQCQDCPPALQACVERFKPHRSAAYRYVQSSMVWQSACQSVTVVSSEKRLNRSDRNALLFVVSGRVGPRNHELDWVQIPLCKRASLMEKEAAHCKLGALEQCIPPPRHVLSVSR